MGRMEILSIVLKQTGHSLTNAEQL